ncbi:MAG: hypothetical protein ACYSTT_20175 [Planctomycetota bacterium]
MSFLRSSAFIPRRCSGRRLRLISSWFFVSHSTLLRACLRGEQIKIIPSTQYDMRYTHDEIDPSAEFILSVAERAQSLP